jgi:transglutaminase-like putative cysteine protease
VDRWLFVGGVALALLLHLLLDQQALVRRWQAAQLDYSPSLLVERGLMALGGFALAVTLAAIMPNLYVYELTAGYYAWIQPMNERMEAVSKRLFPGLAGVVPWQPGGVGGGLPNAFLLGGGSALGQRTVMRVRTNEPAYSYDQPPLAHPLRGATFSDYAGLGWNNPPNLLLTSYEAEEAWAELGSPRRPLLQSVNLEFNSPVIYAAGEPEAPSISYVAQERFPGDLVALTTARTRSYTVISQLPALDEDELLALPAWGAGNPLPPEYAIFLALPDTVTQRTRDLAAQLAGEATSPYAAAAAIEAYLRQIPYDLEIDAPPAGVSDVTDYFLFDLRRGYCDYYATAFAVLARLAGLPTRFVTGFASGNWSTSEQQWVITEAEAHSWPEVYFPQVGWVRFEPTAYRPPAPRIGLPESLALAAAAPAFEPLPPPAERPWLPLWWAALAALPLLALAWGVLRWQSRREDPWLGLLRWGRRAGRPLQEGETALEYGESLAQYVQSKHAKAQDMSRTAGREMQSLSREVSAAQYGPLEERPSFRQQAAARWARLRQYLRRL